MKICNLCGMTKAHSEFYKLQPGQGDRFGLSARCKECERPRRLQWHKDNPLRSKAMRKAGYAKTKKEASEYAKAYRKTNPESVKAAFKKWQDNNRAKLTAKQRAKDAHKKRATPPWLSFIQQAQIAEFYELADARRTQTGKDFHVDHIFPLDGKKFSGLHVPWNLQVISAFDNLSKKNRIPKEHAHLFWDVA